MCLRDALICIGWKADRGGMVAGSLGRSDWADEYDLRIKK